MSNLLKYLVPVKKGRPIKQQCDKINAGQTIESKSEGLCLKSINGPSNSLP